MSTRNASSRNDRAASWWRLGLAVVAVAIVWGSVLPRLEQTPRVQARIKQLADHGIDPAAFFYTDHEGMNGWEASIHESQRRNPATFW